MISKKQIKRLKEDLLDLEKQVGRPLRKTPRDSLWECPIHNFAPDKDSEGRLHVAVCAYDLEHYLPKQYDSGWHWWKGLRNSEREAVTKEIIVWLKTRERK